MIGFDRFWFSKIRDRILLNDRLRSFMESSTILKPFIRSQANEIFDLVSGFVYSQILYACVSLDLFEKLRHGPITLETLSKSCGIKFLEMKRLIDGAAALGLLEKRQEGLIGLGYKGVVILTKPSISVLVKHHSTLYKDLIDPITILQRKNTSTSLGSFWPYAQNQKNDSSQITPEVARRYSDVMSISQPLISEQICSTYNFRRHKKILDLGGGLAASIGGESGRWFLDFLDGAFMSTTSKRGGSSSSSESSSSYLASLSDSSPTLSVMLTSYVNRRLDTVGGIRKVDSVHTATSFRGPVCRSIKSVTPPRSDNLPFLGGGEGQHH